MTLILAWMTAVVGGMGILWRHALTPGAAAKSQASWPLHDVLQRTNGMATLIMTLHPQCPCSRASVDQLERLTARCSGKMCTYVLLAEPASLNERAECTALWKRVLHIPGVVAMADKNGNLARRLGAKTSGQVFLYDASGRLKFSGGITSARGHEGDSDGMDAIQAILDSKSDSMHQAPVFGCSIW